MILVMPFAKRGLLHEGFNILYNILFSYNIFLIMRDELSFYVAMIESSIYGNVHDDFISDVRSFPCHLYNVRFF